MKFTLQFFVCVLSIAIIAACAPASNGDEQETPDTDTAQIEQEPEQAKPAETARPAHWGYQGEDGPANWGKLSPAYAACAQGKQQSPVNIPGKGTGKDVQLEFDYKTTSFAVAHNEHMHDILDNGHTIQCSVDEGSTFKLGDVTYNLKQFHFHTPSEHTIDGKNLPMEMHFVHQSDDGHVAVVGVLFEEGEKPNENIAMIIANLPANKGETNTVEGENIDLAIHLPRNKSVYHYKGSFTTPPCTEDVQWVILRDRLTVTKDQVQAISARIGPNNRPVQALNDREVVVTRMGMSDNN